MTAVAGPDRDALFEERDFLLRSLDDLEAERAEGNLDAPTYERLRDEYTARTADVLRAITERRAQAPERPGPRRYVVIGLVLLGAIVAGIVLARSLGTRGPGELPTGNVAGATEEERLASLEEQVAEDPDNLALRLNFAQRLDAAGEALRALQEYDAVLQRDAAQVGALTQSGWLLYRVAAATGTSEPSTADLLAEARRRLERAVAAEGAPPDAAFFYGVVLFRGYGEAAAAVPLFQQFLAADPDNPLAPQVRELLAEATTRAAEPPPSTPTAPTTPTTTGPPP